MPRTASPQIIQLLISFLMLLIELGVLAYFITLLALNFRDFKHYWKRGLALGAIFSLLSVPPVVLGLCYFDFSQLNTGGQMPPEVLGFMPLFIGIGVFGMLMALVPLRWMYYHVAAAEWRKLRPDAMPLLTGSGPAPWRSIGVGTLVGIVAGVLSMVVFTWVETKPGEGLQHLLKFFPGLQEANPVLVTLSGALFVTVMAVVEELIFRGGMLATLLRAAGRNRLAIWAAIAAVSLVWAFLHLQNTDAPFLKVSQIFLLGLVFGQLARRYCLEAAIAAHVALNLSAILVTPLLLGQR